MFLQAEPHMLLAPASFGVEKGGAKKELSPGRVRRGRGQQGDATSTNIGGKRPIFVKQTHAKRGECTCTVRPGHKQEGRFIGLLIVLTACKP